VSEDLSWARGNGENDIQAVTGALQSARTSATTCRTKAVQLLLACGAYGLPQAWRTPTRAHTTRATAPPATVMRTLCKGATQGTHSRREKA